MQSTVTDRTTDRILVRFEGEGAGSEPLSWGQYELWQSMDRLGTWLPISEVSELATGTTVDEVVEALRFWISRYQPLRTRLRFDPDGVSQVVSREGEIALEVVDAGNAEDPATVAGEIAQRYHDTGFDYVADWPMRMAVIRHRGVLTHQVLVACHLATDAVGGQLLQAALAERDPVTGAANTPPPSMQPLAQSRWQRSAAGVRHSDAADRFFRDGFRKIPARRFGDSGDPRQPRYWELRFSSPALHLATQAIVARTGSGSGLVLLASFAIAQARVSGTNPAAILVVVNNRFRPELADVVGPHCEVTLFVIDVAGAGFDEALNRTRRRALTAYKYAYHDPRRRLDSQQQISQERGEKIEIGCFYNDRRLHAFQDEQSTGGNGPAAGRRSAPTPEQVQSALAATTLHCQHQRDEPSEKLFFHIDDVTDRIHITIQADTHHIAPSQVEALVREMEAAAVDAAFDGAAPTRVPRTPTEEACR